MMVGIEDIYAARQRVSTLLSRTPLEYSPALTDLTGVETYLKLEMMRPTRAFKVRGAVNYLLAMPKEQRQDGVVAASGGSHAVGLAYAANLLGIPATIVMTERSPANLREICRGYGAKVLVSGAVYDDAALAAQDICRRTGQPLIHSYDDPWIVAGQGTIGIEIMEDLPEVDVVVAPVGGGGLLAGVGCAIKTLNPSAKVIGVEPEQAAAMTLSLEAGRQIQLSDPRSLADKLVVKTPGALNLAMAQMYVDHMVKVSEGAIGTGIVTLLRSASILAEGAAAATLAGLFALKDSLQGKKVALILTGGNIAPDVLATVLADEASATS